MYCGPGTPPLPPAWAPRSRLDAGKGCAAAGTARRKMMDPEPGGEEQAFVQEDVIAIIKEVH
jgi:hypothetical protein